MRITLELGLHVFAEKPLGIVVHENTDVYLVLDTRLVLGTVEWALPAHTVSVRALMELYQYRSHRSA